MNVSMKHDLSKIAPAFQFNGEFVSAEPWGSGHINDTYRLKIDENGQIVHYIAQRINDKVFPDVPKMMENIERVTEHLRKKLEEIPGSDPKRETLNVIRTVDDMPYHVDEDGNYWRAYIFVERAETIDFVSSPQQAYEAAKAFGRFQCLLRDLPGGPLHEVIPDFHHTPKRFEKFLQVLENAAPEKIEAAKTEIAFAKDRKDEIGLVVDKLASGELPLRVTHNDTKINNVMLSNCCGSGVCVIDLDTIMPGSVLYDFGDEVRTSTVNAAEDERDLSKVKFSLEYFNELVRGYLESAAEFLVPAEVELLAYSGRLITFEIGLRFLTDFLEGDVYFKVHREGHNLDRCRTQFEMVRQMEAQKEQMEAIVAEHYKQFADEAATAG
ncbi:MAG: aminoglycoside phosphotransferase family protein [Oligosphaeraceae bacterium]|nr:aminoglycoside phosphotransferase family protein [Oligosphaeraceae bacterium]